jgi:hypothetical protein
MRDLAVAGAAALLVIAPVLVVHDQVLGSPFDTPYVSHVRPEDPRSDQDLGSYDLTRVPEAAFGMFVSPFLRGARQGGSALLQTMFWALLALPGAALAVGRRSPFRRVLAVLITVATAATVFYLSFRASGPGAVQFGGLHYFKMWWPTLAILAALAAVTSVRWAKGREAPAAVRSSADPQPDDVSGRR